MDIFDDWDNRELLIYFQSLISRCLKDPTLEAPEGYGETIAEQIWLMNDQLGNRLHALVNSPVHTQVFGRLWPKYLVCYERQLLSRQESLQQALAATQQLLRAIEMDMIIPALLVTNQDEDVHDQLTSAAD